MFINHDATVACKGFDLSPLSRGTVVGAVPGRAAEQSEGAMPVGGTQFVARWVDESARTEAVDSVAAGGP